jgi:hypothetical protein
MQGTIKEASQPSRGRKTLQEQLLEISPSMHFEGTAKDTERSADDPVSSVIVASEHSRKGDESLSNTDKDLIDFYERDAKPEMKFSNKTLEVMKNLRINPGKYVPLKSLDGSGKEPYVMFNVSTGKFFQKETILSKERELGPDGFGNFVEHNTFDLKESTDSSLRKITFDVDGNHEKDVPVGEGVDKKTWGTAPIEIDAPKQSAISGSADTHATQPDDDTEKPFDDSDLDITLDDLGVTPITMLTPKNQQASMIPVLNGVAEVNMSSAGLETKTPVADILDEIVETKAPGEVVSTAGVETKPSVTKTIETVVESVVDAPVTVSSLETNENTDPFEAFTERLKTSKAYEDKTTTINRLIESISLVRSGSRTLEELKRDFGRHFGFYSDIKKLIAAEREMKKLQEDVSGNAKKDESSGASDTVDTHVQLPPYDEKAFKKELRSDPKWAELRAVQEDFLRDTKNTDFAHLDLKKPKETEVSLGQERGTNVLKDRLFGKDWDKKKAQEGISEKIVLNEELFGKVMSEEERVVFEKKNKNIEMLRQTMASARQDYVRVRDDKTNALDKLKRFFGGSIKDTIDNEIETEKIKYNNAVTNYTNARLDMVREMSVTADDLKRNLVGVLKEIELFEGTNRYGEGTDNKARKIGEDVLARSVSFIDTYREFYKGLTTVQKLAFSGAVMGFGVVLGATGGASVAAAGLSMQRIMSALSAGRGLQLLGNELAQRSFEKNSEGNINQVETDMASLENNEAFSKKSTLKKAELMVETIRNRCQADIAKNTERIDRLENNRNRSKYAGMVTGALLSFGVPQWAIGKFFQLEDVHAVVSDVGNRVQEVGGAIHHQIRGFLDTYSSVGSQHVASFEAPSVSHEVLTNHAGDMHSKLVFPEMTDGVHKNLGHMSVMSQDITPVKSTKVLFESIVTAPLPHRGTVIGSLRDMKVPDMHPIEIAKEWFTSKINMNNPFFVPDTMTMPGAQVVVEDGKIVDIVDKQGVLLGAIRNLSGGQNGVWREIKNMTVDQIQNDHSGKYKKTLQIMGEYMKFLGKDMPPMRPDKSMQQLASETVKAYYKKKGWA